MGIDLKVIDCTMGGHTLVEKSVIEDFNSKSQLIVHESQEALFFKDGQALDLFASGRHTLNSDNLPLLKRVFGKIFGGETPFPCEVYFVNKINVLDVLWGTDTPVVVEDPKYHLIVNVRANGQTGIHVVDSRRFVVKVVGQLPEVSADHVRRSIKGMLISSIKEIIAQTIVEKGVSILEVTTMLSLLSQAMQEKLNARIADIGLAVDHFAVESIFGDGNDLAKLREAKERRLEMMNEAELEAYRMTILSEARAKARATEGYTYQDERRFDVLEGAAKNEGAGAGFVNLGVGMGVGVGVGHTVANMAADIMGGTSAPPAIQPVPMRMCTKCGGSVVAEARFCSLCGNPVESRPAFCPQCGEKCATGARFCASCGNKLGE